MQIVYFALAAALGALPGFVLILRYLRLLPGSVRRALDRFGTLDPPTRLGLAQLVVAIVGVVVAIIGIIAVILSSGNSDPSTQTPTPSISASPSQPPSPTPSLTPFPTPAPTPTLSPTEAPPPELTDNFNCRLDPTVWRSVSDAGAIYAADGALNLQAEGPFEGASLKPFLNGRPIKEVSFLISVKSYQGDHPAGAGITVVLADGTEISLDVGGSGDPGSELRICNASGVCNYDPGLSPRVGTPWAVEVLWTSDGLEFNIDGTLFRKVPTILSTSDVKFFIYADRGGSLHDVADDFRLVFADG